ncbi:GNAT family N-acetyltransferase [Ktedonospora formicarum]|uniref:N-acetyltransferase n=1 Tax=Ktedonospora formicarum TaxID=2778364 RepID=A0A8J3MRU2_9CHLR|nr:GNAT family N-acetyltransferase [Ktedonospora formicarum]GHO44171.1 N-acetyltransferase [Ktedonospora formicarum]
MSMHAALEMSSIKPEETYHLRHSVLRPMQMLADCAYPEDKQAQTLHAGCYLNGRLVGVGTIFREDREEVAGRIGWRIRGMAVSSEARGSGCGGAILQTLLNHARMQTSTEKEIEVWCNGRANVEGFYRRYGFQRQGEIFEVPPIGPHVLMVRFG